LKSWLKYITLLVLLILGLFTPKLSKACAKHATKPAFVTPSKKQEQHSLSKTIHQTTSCEKENQHKNCKDQCKGNTCDCSSATRVFGFPILSTLVTQQHVVELSKQQFGFKQVPCATGYFSIWHPPKITFS
jgi:hypothetical protein